MYATVNIEALLKERSVLVRREAMIDTGDRQLVFVTQQIGRFEPRLVKVGVFKPLAFTKTFAMAAASVLAITIIPVLMIYLIISL